MYYVEQRKAVTNKVVDGVLLGVLFSLAIMLGAIIYGHNSQFINDTIIDVLMLFKGFTFV